MTKTVKGAMRFGDNLLDVLRGFIRMFEKGVDEVVAFFKKIIDDFFDWLEDMFKKGKADEVLEKRTIFVNRLLNSKINKKDENHQHSRRSGTF